MSTKPTALTRRQRRCLQAVLEFQAEHGYSPTLREIQAAMGLRSQSGVARHLELLRAQGCVTWEDGKARTLRVLTNTKETP